MNIQLIYHNNKVQNPFRHALSSVKDGNRLKISVPYISLNELEELLENVEEWLLLSDLSEWVRTETNHEAIVAFLNSNQSRIRHIESLHAKVFIGKKRALVSSSNLTPAGLDTNEEMGVLIEASGLVKELEGWFDHLWHDTTPIDIKEIRSKLRSLKPAVAHQQPSIRFSFGRKRRTPPNASDGTTLLGIPPQDEVFYRFQQKLSRVQKHGYAVKETLEIFFNLAKLLLNELNLDKFDPRLTFYVPGTKEVLIALTVNQRYALAVWYDKRNKHPIDILIMTPRAFIEKYNLKADHLFKNFRGETKPPVLVSYNELKGFLNSAHNESSRARRNQAFIRAMVSGAQYELSRQAASGFRRFHRPWLYDVAVDDALRAKLMQILLIN